jgi:hypothetical protein
MTRAALVCGQPLRKQRTICFAPISHLGTSASKSIKGVLEKCAKSLSVVGLIRSKQWGQYVFKAFYEIEKLILQKS